MTEEWFREDAYQKVATTRVTERITLCPQSKPGAPEPPALHGFRLEGTIFYPAGGGQPGDRGILTQRGTDGKEIRIEITNTIKDGSDIVHLAASEADLNDLRVGEPADVAIDWERRYRHMRFHTAMHLLCSLVPHGVTGGNLTHERARLDFDSGGQSMDKAALERDLNRLMEEDHPVSVQWITDDEMACNPDLVRTLSVSPPKGAGKVRLVRVADVDLQPCGGTHLKRTGEIGRLRVRKVESKGKRNKRVSIGFAEDAGAGA